VKLTRRFLPVVVLLLSACRPRGPVIEFGGYSFRCEGKEYRIESVTPDYMEGYNVLTRRIKDELVMKALDKDQDGVLDEIVSGDVTVDEAGRIYKEGLKEGERRHLIKTRPNTREYRTSDVLSDCVLITYILALGDIYNKFTVSQFKNFQNSTVLLDSDADGKLDLVEKGPGTIASFQSLYNQIIDKARRENKLIVSNGKYIVVP
jgi:hypothetical protein